MKIKTIIWIIIIAIVLLYFFKRDLLMQIVDFIIGIFQK
jgi:hypothetical protein